jgi:hypothetical protein
MVADRGIEASGSLATVEALAIENGAFRRDRRLDYGAGQLMRL